MVKCVNDKLPSRLFHEIFLWDDEGPDRSHCQIFQISWFYGYEMNSVSDFDFGKSSGIDQICLDIKKHLFGAVFDIESVIIFVDGEDLDSEIDIINLSHFAR